MKHLSNLPPGVTDADIEEQQEQGPPEHFIMARNAVDLTAWDVLAPDGEVVLTETYGIASAVMWALNSGDPEPDTEPGEIAAAILRKRAEVKS